MKTIKTAASIILCCLFMFLVNFHNTLQERRKERLEKYKAGYYDNTTLTDNKVVPNTESRYIPPETWKKYKVAKAFSICVPPTVELRADDDPYTKDLKDLKSRGYDINSDNVVFQQKGLSTNEADAYQTYCRIIISVQRGDFEEFPKYSEYEDLTTDDIRNFQELATQGQTEYKILIQPNVRWIKIEDTYGIEVEYVREGIEDFHTHVSYYYFFNDHLCATIVLSYRQNDKHNWESDFSKIIKTFEWISKY